MTLAAVAGAFAGVDQRGEESADLFGVEAERVLGPLRRLELDQALAQVCELTWQLRGQAGDRQVEGAKVGITANQGLFGHGSSVIVKR